MFQRLRALRADEGLGVVVEQLVRLTGLTDPLIEVRPVSGRSTIHGRNPLRAERNERVLVTTLTKRMAEDLPSTTPNWGSGYAISIRKSRRSIGSKS